MKNVETALTALMASFIVITMLMYSGHKWADNKKIFLVLISGFAFGFIFSGLIELILQLLANWLLGEGVLDLSLVSRGITGLTTILIFPIVIRMFVRDTFDKAVDYIDSKIDSKIDNNKS